MAPARTTCGSSLLASTIVDGAPPAAGPPSRPARRSLSGSPRSARDASVAGGAPVRFAEVDVTAAAKAVALKGASAESLALRLLAPQGSKSAPRGNSAALYSEILVRRCLSRIAASADRGDKAYDVAAFVGDLRARKVTPHIAIDGNVRVTGKPRKTAIDGRTTRHPGYDVSQRIRKRIEESFGWIKTTGNLAKTRHKGLERVGWNFTLTAAAYNLVRIPKLIPAG